jgi:nucleoside-diphosphate-sugar epimerase
VQARGQSPANDAITNTMNEERIVLTGAAGLVGQNLLPRLRESGFQNITAIDKHAKNSAILEAHHPEIRVLHADIALDDEWQNALAGCSTLVIGHAQIGGVVAEEFVRNNIEATRRLLAAAVHHKVKYIVHMSSSVVNSMAVDDYTETKKAQEALIAGSGIKHVILRPTLMFGWFDRKHLGWLARFMRRVPVFPIPGSGRYVRQPLYAGDFCDIIVASIRRQVTGIYNISGQERIDYIDLIRAVKRATGSRVLIQRVPYSVFWLLLRTYAIFDRNPPFTTTQLRALVTPDIFEVIDWPKIFGVRPTPLNEALQETFGHPVYSKVVLEF